MQVELAFTSGDDACATFLVVYGLVIATFSGFWYNLNSIGAYYA